MVCLPLLLPLLGFLPVSEQTYEFDAGNFRLRYCERWRAWLFGTVLRERCGPPSDHPVAVRLRELGALENASETRTRWVLIKGRKPGVRGWSGEGKEYIRALGATSFGTPVPLPTDEGLNRNGWIRWASRDPRAVNRYWARVRSAPAGDYHVLRLAGHARGYLETHPLPADEVELESLVLRELDRR